MSPSGTYTYVSDGDIICIQAHTHKCMCLNTGQNTGQNTEYWTNKYKSALIEVTRGVYGFRSSGYIYFCHVVVFFKFMFYVI